MAIGNSDFAVGGLAFLVHGPLPFGASPSRLASATRWRVHDGTSDQSPTTTAAERQGPRAIDGRSDQHWGRTSDRLSGHDGCWNRPLSRGCPEMHPWLADSHKAGRRWPSGGSYIEGLGRLWGVRTRPVSR